MNLSTKIFLTILKYLSRLKFINRLLPMDQNIILCYHHLGSSSWNFSITKSEFSKQISYLAKNFTIVPLSEMMKTKNTTGKPRVAITFDDGYQSVYRIARRILEKFDIKPTVFVIGNPREVDRHALGNHEPIMNLRQIKALHSAGWEIGFHTQTHPDTSTLTQAEIETQVITGKREMETKLGFEIPYFSYPKGIANPVIKKAVSQAGYWYAFTVSGGQVNQNDKLAVSRITVSKDLNVRNFPALLSSIGIIINHAFTKILEIKDGLFNQPTGRNHNRLIISTFDDITSPHYAGGGAIAVHELAKRLAGTYSLEVFSWNHSGMDREVIDGVSYRRFGFGFLHPKLSMALFQLTMPILAITQKYHLWLESFSPPFTTSMLPLFTGKPVVGIVHMLAADDMTRKYKIPIFKIIEKYGIQTYSQIITTTEQIKSRLALINPRASINVISNGIEEVSHPPTKKLKQILFIGRFEIDQKGLDLLIPAFKKFSQQNKNYRLIFAGQGSAKELNKLNELAKRHGIKQKIIFSGYVTGKQKQQLLNRSACMVISSRFETFSLVALEAMAAGLPIVCFDIDGLGWISKQAAIKAEPFSISQFATAIQQVTTDSGLVKSMQTAGIKYAEKYTWETIAGQYHRYIQNFAVINPSNHP